MGPPLFIWGCSMIRVTCQRCKGSCNAPDNAQGKRLKCPHCEAPLPIPYQAEAVTPPRPETVWVRVEVEDEPPAVNAAVPPKTSGPMQLLDGLTEGIAGALDQAIMAWRGTNRWVRYGVTAASVAALFGILVLAVVLGVVPSSNRHSETEVIIDAIAIARTSLRSPSTAEFPSSGWNREAYSVAKTGENQYTVSSYVDAQNGFGATLRQPWTVTFEYVGDSHIKPVSVSIGP